MYDPVAILCTAVEVHHFNPDRYRSLHGAPRPKEGNAARTLAGTSWCACACCLFMLCVYVCVRGRAAKMALLGNCLLFPAKNLYCKSQASAESGPLP